MEAEAACRVTYHLQAATELNYWIGLHCSSHINKVTNRRLHQTLKMLSAVVIINLCLISLCCRVDAQQQLPAYYSQAELYAMPWETVAPASLQSLTYTGPQRFPSSSPVPAEVSQQTPISMGLFRPHSLQTSSATAGSETNFKLPFRPSPFAGYSDGNEEQSPQLQKQEQQLRPPLSRPGELPFHAPGYYNTKPIGGPSTKKNSDPRSFTYMSPSYLYNLFRN
ncbi:uncharacterized protein LOC115629196 [Scaptodrosophila lebanonensis]|uniref:Uncharacterized protein LOC115629196 n=1 Tax=Drosophila lebanonensis TaxID=7225 RepID=A0A6J2TY46_DROLE|nr:uncharacterized protein LOC115629196 [Scaptodrosophila lebanonensis]